ncbi:MAG: hypothetical protein P1V19_17865 [Gimesia sp.]|nr:hypothetical protein [Gimesia sp.]
MSSITDNGGSEHSDHTPDKGEMDGMCCASGIFSCSTVAMLALDELLKSPLDFSSAYPSIIENMMIDGLIQTLDRPPRLS